MIKLSLDRQDAVTQADLKELTSFVVPKS